MVNYRLISLALTPQLVKKNQPRITGMDNQSLSLYAKVLWTGNSRYLKILLIKHNHLFD
ncbi:hypothetical protein KJE01_23130 [Escherichia marmotae]|uniref:hypothetical protein n=1 Tax=Escherichia marmotae TaxID=1499973 RepID=UPI0012FF9B02|nr:hypothetical protein [Escherichia marmotae]MDQ9306236.1 hypothetical protein [Escherichia marmotae]